MNGEHRPTVVEQPEDEDRVEAFAERKEEREPVGCAIRPSVDRCREDEQCDVQGAVEVLRELHVGAA